MNDQQYNELREQVLQAYVNAEWLTGLIKPGSDAYFLYQAALKHLLMEIAGDDQDLYETISETGFVMTRPQIEKAYGSATPTPFTPTTQAAAAAAAADPTA